MEHSRVADGWDGQVGRCIKMQLAVARRVILCLRSRRDL
jgi:hypothetical protein